MEQFNAVKLTDEFKKNGSMMWVEEDNIKLFVSDAFKSQALKDLITKHKGEIVEFLKLNRIFSREDFDKKNIFRSGSDSTILSFAQERLWFIEQYEDGTNAYHMPAIFELDKGTDEAGIKYALQQVVSRHEVLRSTISKGKDGYGFQKVNSEPLETEDIILSEKDDYESLIKADINRPFNLGAEYPVRIRFYYIYSTRSLTRNILERIILVINVHHIATDGWSLDIFQRELFAYYEAYVKGDKDFRLPVLDIQYRDYAVWQRSYLTGDVLEKQLSYWKKKLSGYQTLELPADHSRPATIDYRGTKTGFSIDEQTSEGLRALAQKNGVTMHSVLLSSITILLGKYTGQEDVITGSPNANRHQWQTEGLIGFFVNMLANRIVLDRTQSFEELIRQVHDEQTEIQLYQELPFEYLVNELGVARDASRHPVFQVMFSLQNFGNRGNVATQQTKYFKPYLPADTYEVEKFDLSIFIDDSGSEFKGQISYAVGLFRKETIDRLIDQYKHLLVRLMETPDIPYSSINLPRVAVYDQPVCDWNTVYKEFPNKTIHELFQQQAALAPDRIVLIYEGTGLTYKELNEKSNQLARHIRAQYFQRTARALATGTLVALYLDRNIEMIVALLAILKAGGAYVPLDISYPQDRIDYLLQDSGAELILCKRHQIEDGSIELPADKMICVDLEEDIYQTEDHSDLPAYSTANNIAYVIYTSGTTGKPKGVIIEHSSVVNLAFNNIVKMAEDDVFAFLSAPVFDASIFEIWTPLLNGNRLVVPQNMHNLIADVKKMSHFITANKISILFLTKTLFDNLYLLDSNIFKSLKYLITGGEALDKNIVNKLVNSDSMPAHFINGYGPTENTTFATTYKMSSEVTSTNVPIGEPIRNCSAYVLDRNLLPVSVGSIGELLIGGASLARGYLNFPALTEERFIANPFTTETDREKGYTRLYRTGDLVRWLPDGNLEFMGRNDSQVKIRGYRIEPGEIETALSRISGIRQSCVLAKERRTDTGNVKYLAAYYVLNTDATALTRSDILADLTESLPDYMIPEAFVEMDMFPVTVNGKLDRAALPEPDFSSSEDMYVAPANETEQLMCDTWQQVLGLKKVGITDSFFSIGGNSILAIQLSHRMSEKLGYDIKVADVFRYKNIRDLLQNIAVPELGDQNVTWKF